MNEKIEYLRRRRAEVGMDRDDVRPHDLLIDLEAILGDDEDKEEDDKAMGIQKGVRPIAQNARVNEVYVFPEHKLWDLTTNRQPDAGKVQGAAAVLRTRKAMDALGAEMYKAACDRVGYFARKHGIDLSE